MLPAELDQEVAGIKLKAMGFDVDTLTPEQDAYLERFIRSRLSEPGDRAQVKKVSDALFRRGYSWEQIKHALNEFDTQGDY